MRLRSHDRKNISTALHFQAEVIACSISKFQSRTTSSGFIFSNNAKAVSPSAAKSTWYFWLKKRWTRLRIAGSSSTTIILGAVSVVITKKKFPMVNLNSGNYRTALKWSINPRFLKPTHTDFFIAILLSTSLGSQKALPYPKFWFLFVKYGYFKLDRSFSGQIFVSVGNSIRKGFTHSQYTLMKNGFGNW